jgi:hypothetical protein
MNLSYLTIYSTKKFVIPAKAGIHKGLSKQSGNFIPKTSKHQHKKEYKQY